MYVRCAVYYMAIGEDESVGREDKPRAGAFAASLTHLNVHYRRSHALYRANYRARIGVQQSGIGVLRKILFRGNRVRKDVLRQPLKRAHKTSSHLDAGLMRFDSCRLKPAAYLRR